ncbi:cytochrome b/b6 domain-containing protein [Dechloromonas sp. XY25]|uniref:Cytochrome b/b6 domain-containing protein n=1 Tax=Dechloromonas hankyongensis TaxID=2908002 RepID=A0ABS9K6X4_9RHOO|nr:cytochrome b/b6 domain-containing protein [Dechloromonas hankyongensis]MCG2578923.1 cytochrome b/b6 domain-containing protein [Dechloromonas hankyongensis]
MNGKQVRVLVWDWPTRLFHWLLAVSVVAAIVSGEVGGSLIECHGRIGLFIVGLLAFRLAWGVVGSTYARFGHFFPTPAKIRAYLQGDWRGHGHNPLGAFSVFALLGVLVIQVGTGLFANDDIAFSGPLSSLVELAVSNRLTGLHHLSGKVLLLLIGLHVGAIAFYFRIKKDNLVKPMLTGWKDADHGVSATGGGLPALLLALAVALGAVYGASGLWLPEPPPAPAAETPNW